MWYIQARADLALPIDIPRLLSSKYDPYPMGRIIAVAMGCVPLVCTLCALRVQHWSACV